MFARRRSKVLPKVCARGALPRRAGPTSSDDMILARAWQERLPRESKSIQRAGFSRPLGL